MTKVEEKLKTLTMVILKYLIDWIVVDYCCDNVEESVDDDDDVIDATESATPDNLVNVEAIDPVEHSDVGKLD
jgi:hypothetical protein